MKTITPKTVNCLSGLSARLWKFSASHDRLTFLLKKEKNQDKAKFEGDTFLIFMFCEKIKVNVGWEIDNPKIVKSDITTYKLIDGEIELHFEECIIRNENEPT